MNGLRFIYLNHVPSSFGPHGEVLIVESNGDRHQFRTLIKGLQTEVFGNAVVLQYLNGRYGHESVCFTLREAVLANMFKSLTNCHQT